MQKSLLFWSKNPKSALTIVNWCGMGTWPGGFFLFYMEQPCNNEKFNLLSDHRYIGFFSLHIHADFTICSAIMEYIIEVWAHVVWMQVEFLQNFINK